MTGVRYNRIVPLIIAVLMIAASTISGSSLQAQSTTTKTLIHNAALVLTMDPTIGTGELGVLENADVFMVDDKIEAVGQNLNVNTEDVTVVDASNKIVMPGFVDAHNHIWQTVIRGCASDEDVGQWLRECVFSLEGSTLTRSDAYAIVRLGALDLIQTGVTTVLDWSHSFNPEFVRGNIQALDESGLRYVYAYKVQANQETVEDIKKVKAELIDPNPLATMQVASHPSSFTVDDLETAVQLANELNVDLNVHLLENIHDRDHDPVTMLENKGALNSRLIANHVVHATDVEIEKLGAADVRATHNPLSNMRLASGVMPATKLHQAGVPIGLGLDGGTNDTSDAFNTMRTAVGLQRAVHLDAKVFPTIPNALWLATMGGAQVLGMQDQIGSLTPGKKADVIIINPKQLNFAPRIDWVSQLVLNGQPGNVEWVFVNGRVLKKNRELVNVNIQQVIDDAEVVGAKVRGIVIK